MISHDPTSSGGARRRGLAAAGVLPVGVVVIGRNEGARLVSCLASIDKAVARVVFVDSGSTDDSVAAAQAAGASVVELDLSRPFTAAKARNAGLAALADDPPRYVQFIDGDCLLRENWIATALAFMDANPQAAVVCGRRRERFVEASVYNRLCDREWDTPVGRTKACGGDALMRLSSVDAVGGFRESMIAGEEPELCLRLRQAGWEIWRLDAEMTWHDAALLRFGAWWRRTRRGGHAFAEGAALHGASPARHWRAETRRALAWGLGLPGAALALGVITPLGFLLLLGYPLQVARLAVREGPACRISWEWALFTTLAKFPEALGVIEFHLRRLVGRRSALIEYK